MNKQAKCLSRGWQLVAGACHGVVINPVLFRDRSRLIGDRHSRIAPKNTG